MTINEIIAKYYEYFHRMCLNTDIPVYDGKTSEDILNDCIITAINKYGDQEIEENEGYEYLKKTFLMENKFSYKRKKNDKIVLMEDYGNKLKIDAKNLIYEIGD